MARLEKIYDVYFNGIKTGTGTKKELSKMLLVSPHSVADKVLDAGHYICFTCEDEKSEDTKND
ncbi:hypothetical protein [Lactococcus lactis]|uniref:Uncharacterized protein n=1 Tax=Lactococcus lactis subsp. lactis TaxID=1360 RepID=A0A2N5W9L2_LACLL|nr:hypothetical protein [Lactococcus lactis]PLW58924.1 hypothetical protein CYU10_002315 [Lactococcus lactis subsp. lactis]